MRRLGGVCYCVAPDCGAMYELSDNDFRGLMSGENLLPCGHKASAVILSATHIKNGDEACEMIDWLMTHNYIDEEAYSEIEKLGGKLEDGLNVRMPKTGELE